MFTSSLAASLTLAAAVQAAPADTLQVVVEPSALEIPLGERRQVRVRVEGAAAAREPRWFSMTPDVVTVGPDGTIEAVAPGEGRVAAVVDNVAGFVTVTVPRLPATALEVALPVRELPAGTSAPLSVAGRTRLGTAVEPADLSFESSDPAVVRVDASGRVFGRTPGRAVVRVRAGEAEVEAEVRVAPAPEGGFRITPEAESVRTGDVLRFRVEAEGGGAALFPAWTVSGTGAQIEAEGPDGVFVAEKPGRYRVTALIGEEAVRSALVEVEARTDRSMLIEVGRGPAASHHSGDAWAFEGVDGRDYVYIGTFMHDWMKAWDVTDPARPVLTDSVQLDARRINDVKIHPNARIGVVTREGASDRRNGIVLLDLSEPAQPTVLSEYQETVTGGVHNVWIDGEHDLVYAAHNGTSDVHIIDISEPAAPREVGRWGLDKEGKTLHDVIVQDGYAYLSYWDDGIIMLDVGAGTHGGTPTDPAFVSQYRYPVGNTHVAWRSGRYLFVGDEIFPDDWDAERPIEARGYIHVVDYQDPENPVEVARYEVPEAGAHNVWVEDDLLYVGYYQAGLRVVDVSGELRGDLYAQGREIARIKTIDEDMVVPNWPMTWGAQLFKGNIISSDLNSGLWITKLQRDPAVVF